MKKSKKRQDAGKNKASSLALWRAECAEARQALKDEGYTGSLKFKKGLPLYEKIREIRQAALSGSAQGGAGSAQGVVGSTQGVRAH